MFEAVVQTVTQLPLQLKLVSDFHQTIVFGYLEDLKPDQNDGKVVDFYHF